MDIALNLRDFLDDPNRPLSEQVEDPEGSLRSVGRR